MLVPRISKVVEYTGLKTVDTYTVLKMVVKVARNKPTNPFCRSALRSSSLDDLNVGFLNLTTDGSTCAAVAVTLKVWFFFLNNEFHSEWNLRFDLRWRNGFLEFRFGPDAASSSPKTRFSVHIAHRVLEYFGRDASGANRLSYSQVRSGRKFIKSDDRSLKRREMEKSETLTIPRLSVGSSVQLTWTFVAISGWWIG